MPRARTIATSPEPLGVKSGERSAAALSSSTQAGGRCCGRDRTVTALLRKRDAMTCECDREQDVLDALSAGRWPARCDEDLRAHVSACGICHDLVDVATALADDRDATWRDARVPSAGVVWWRAQLRAREDAARAAGRPVAFIQGVAASVAVWLAIALFRAMPGGVGH